jgi:hypothetical protein
MFTPFTQPDIKALVLTAMAQRAEIPASLKADIQAMRDRELIGLEPPPEPLIVTGIDSKGRKVRLTLEVIADDA